MNFDYITERIESLNEDWFKSKKSFFTLEPFYDKEIDKIIIEGEPQHWEHEDEETGEYNEGLYYPDTMNYSFYEYCWFSKFEGSLAYKNIEIIDGFPSEIHNLPIDGAEVCESLMKYYRRLFKTIADHSWIAKEIIHDLEVIKKAFLIKKDYSDFDKTKYFIFKKFRDTIMDVYGSHVTIYKKHLINPISITLTTDLCSIIAGFDYKGKSLVTNFVGADSKGLALYQILTKKKQEKSTIKVYVEDWEIELFYYLLYLIDLKIHRINFSDLKSSKSIFLKNGKLFNNDNYSKFISSKLSSYSPAKKEIIDSKISSLFNR